MSSLTVTEAIAVIQAAKDRGDSRGDKDRKGTISSLVRKATALQSQLPADTESYPEVQEALSVVADLVNISSKLDQQAEALKRAPTGSAEAEEAQAALDKSRKNVDGMLHPLEATVSALETLVEATLEMEAMYRESMSKVSSIKESLLSERERLAAVARAVHNAAKLG